MKIISSLISMVVLVATIFTGRLIEFRPVDTTNNTEINESLCCEGVGREDVLALHKNDILVEEDHPEYVEKEEEEILPEIVSENEVVENNPYFGYTEEDYKYLLMTIVGEAQHCSKECQLYVGSVLLNRVKSKWFPHQDTIKQAALWDKPIQYACFWGENPQAYKEPTETNIEVALELLQYGSVLPENVLFQANFKQGQSVYAEMEKLYFCTYDGPDYAQK